MSTPRQKLKKPPACDACKARRVLCHPQPKGAPCPRCIEKDAICTTTPIPRGRPRKKPASSADPSQTSSPPRSSTMVLAPLRSITLQTSLPVLNHSNDCPELSIEFVEHCFDCFTFLPQTRHPLLNLIPIESSIRSVSFDPRRLPHESRVLALCIIALASLVSFDEAVLGSGPRPQSVRDHIFFSSSADVLSCGTRRVHACRALYEKALAAAWEARIILQPSPENALSCYLLDILEQCGGGRPDTNYTRARPWGGAYFSHLRVLAPRWREGTYSPSVAAHWAGFLMADALMSTGLKTPILFTLNDQLLLSGPAPPSLEASLASLEAAAQKPGLQILFNAMPSYLWHISSLARELSETITGDYARLNPLSETAVLKSLASLSLTHTITSLLLDRVDATGAAHRRALLPPSFVNLADVDTLARSCGYAAAFAFAALSITLFNELRRRDAHASRHALLSLSGETETPATARMRARVRLLRDQARSLALQGVRALARAIPYFSAGHYSPVQWSGTYACAEFCAEEFCCAEEGMDADAGLVRDIRTIAREIKTLGYSLDLFSTPRAAALLAQLDGVGETLAPDSEEYPQMALQFDPAMLSYMFLPLDGGELFAEAMQ